MINAFIASASEISESDVAVLVSSNIKPYLETVQGVDMIINNAGINSDIFFLDKYKGKNQERLASKLKQNNYDLFIAVGSDAADFAWSKFQDKTLFTMVLHPEKMTKAPDKICGIPLNIPVDTQLKNIKENLPGLKNIGLLYDPKYNSSFFNQAYESGIKAGLKIVPLKITSKKELPAIIGQNWNKVDCLWMIPDYTVISESIIKYVIKEALFKKIPVIGYNSFFYESGAVMSFIIDYETLGKQTGETALKILKGDLCKDNEPEFQIWLNHKILNKLGISSREIERVKGNLSLP